MTAETTAPGLLLAGVSHRYEHEPVLCGLDLEIARGEIVFHDFCANCHGMAVRSGGTIPDLRRMTPE